MASNYNAAPRPAVALVRDGNAKVIRKRETYANVYASDVIE
jgi:diaminopimelate decarboxylase